ncbi:MAG TPA: MotA/TolQ/ExbB proton channel family protein [Caulobacteraceae bacterium]|jgi:biopolymer transport protein ExbB|nr:MotA/TolQ/ExbB proton channel family protein [Caulobacteraceae bacterium]
MLQTKRTTPILALFGAMALLTAGMTAAPAFAQGASNSTAAAAPAPAAATNAAAAPAPAASSDDAAPTHVGGSNAGHLNPWEMFLSAKLVVQIVMVLLAICSLFSWTILIIKIFEFLTMNRNTSRFLESWRGARSIAEMGKIAEADEFAGLLMADMAASAAAEVELSRQAGLLVAGEHRDTTIIRAQAAVNAVQASLARRLSGGMQFLATVGSTGPFVGLFGTVYGIMDSFIGIANTNTTNLAVVAPGIAEALLATGLGLFAAIPSVVFYNYFQTQITAYGSRSEGFQAELMNAISRQLDKGA